MGSMGEETPALLYLRLYFISHVILTNELCRTTPSLRGHHHMDEAGTDRLIIMVT